MNELYVMDACALLAFFNDEQGADFVDDIFKKAHNTTAQIIMHSLNLLEVYYDICRKYGEDRAAHELTKMKQLPMTINTEISGQLFKEAGRLKASYKISLADSIALAQAFILRAKLITSDHHEFDLIEKNEPINFLWIR